MSKKRSREIADVQVALVEIYEDLAHEDEEIRVKAARNLLVNHISSATPEKLATVLTRLFRGLCSGRKSARIGFSIALTEVLTFLHTCAKTGSPVPISNAAILDILDSQTVLEGQTSGQDERDHYLGRLFGCEAIIKSRILLNKQDLLPWKRLLDILCEIAAKKPWLRQECGFILYTTIRIDLNDVQLEDYAVDILDKLNSHKLVRTPEGVAIWIEVAHQFPQAQLPKHIWKHENPLAEQDVTTLAKVLMDIPSKAQQDSGSFESQGSAVWSTQLHFAWDIVLAELYAGSTQDIDGYANGTKKKSKRRQISFETFWNVVVNNGLCHPTSSTERKHWGLLLFAKCVESCPTSLLLCLFTDNVLKCLSNALVEDDRPLKRSGKKALRLIQPRLEKACADGEVNLQYAKRCLVCLLNSAESGDFDQGTKTKLVEDMMASGNQEFLRALQTAFHDAIQRPAATDPRMAYSQRRKLLQNYVKLFAQICRSIAEGSRDRYHLLRQCSNWLIEQAYFEAELDGQVAYNSEFCEQVRDRTAQCLEQVLKLGTEGVGFVNNTVSQIHKLESHGHSRITEFGNEVDEIVQQAWTGRQSLLSTRNGTQDHGQPNGTKTHPIDEREVINLDFRDGLALLYSLTLLSVYNGEPDAVEMLEDLLSYRHSALSDPVSTKSKSGDSKAADELMLILRNFASRPSKFFRRVALSSFEAMAPRITAQGLQPFIQVLQCSEDGRGLQKLTDMDEDHESDEGVNGTDVEMDSDVELLSPELGGSEKESSDTNSDAEDTIEDVSSTSGDEDEAQTALEAALASALGTKKAEANEDSSSSESDSDMDDEQMMQLDEKLAQVFRDRQQNSSIKDQRKKDQKDAKETMINLKNRCLDFIDSFLKLEYLSSISLQLILPLLEAIRTTQTKQVADHAFSVLRDYCKRCSGKNVPSIRLDKDETGVDNAIGLLKNIHNEACLEGSNAHAIAASQASILLVKVLVNAAVNTRVIIDIYGDTREKQLTAKVGVDACEECHVQPGFFTDWNNWCASFSQ